MMLTPETILLIAIGVLTLVVLDPTRDDTTPDMLAEEVLESPPPRPAEQDRSPRLPRGG
jgi:hypothetical protein